MSSLSLALLPTAAALPDLSAEWLMSTCTDLAGDPAVPIALTNTGDAPSAGFYVDVYIHEEIITLEHFEGLGDVWVWIPGLAPGEWREIVVPFPGAEKEVWQIAVRVDLDGFAAESATWNNFLYSWFSDYVSSPDLRVQSLSVQWIDGARRAVTTVHNAGLGDAPASLLAVQLCSGPRAYAPRMQGEPRESLSVLAMGLSESGSVEDACRPLRGE